MLYIDISSLCSALLNLSITDAGTFCLKTKIISSQLVRFVYRFGLRTISYENILYQNTLYQNILYQNTLYQNTLYKTHNTDMSVQFNILDFLRNILI